jgi:hypothetical protein
VVGGRAFFIEDFAFGSDLLAPVAREPEAVLIGKAVQGADALEGGGDFFDGGGSSGCGDGGGKHPGTSGQPVSG